MRSIRNPILVICLVAGMSIADRSGAGQVGGVGIGRPDLEALRSHALTHALQTPENLWQFLTDPQTPYTERMAAATQGKRLFPLSWLSRLMRAQETLQEEQSLHQWGLRPSPHSAGAGVRSDNRLPPAERKRLILGHAWVAPEPPTAFEPENWQEAQTAPWPWQVQSGLAELFQQITPKMHIHNPPGDVAYAEAWYAEALKMPCRTDKEAQRFVEATTFPMHYKSLRVLTRWRQIALDPRFPHAAQSVASQIADAMRLWGDPRAQAIGQALTCDILRQSHVPRVRFDAAWYSRHLKERLTEYGDGKLPPPLAVVVALGDAATDSRSGSEGERLYYFVSPACALLPDPPIQGDINSMAPGSPEAHRALATFCDWFHAHRAELAKAGEEQLRARPEIAAIRAGK
jgi:hypothetical protein